MRWLGPVLLVGVFARHNLAWSLPGYNPQAWFYIMGGMWEIILCSTLLLALPAQPLFKAAMWIGILEGAQVSACRLATTGPIGKDANLCDALTGWHVGAIMTGVYLFIVCPAIGKAWHSYFGRGYEIALGVALAILVTIGGNEIAHLVNPIAALLVMAGACVSGILAYERAT